MLLMLQDQQPPVAVETTPSEISSTTDVLAELHLKRREEASNSTKGQSLHDLEAEAAPFETDPEEVIPEKRGEAGMIIILSLCFLFRKFRFLVFHLNSKVHQKMR